MASTRNGDPVEAKWQPARLIPAGGIKGQTEQEMRATSSLLAVMVAVPDFGKNIVARLGAPAGQISTFTEVRFDDEEGKTLRPDGAIVVERGKTRGRASSRSRPERDLFSPSRSSRISILRVRMASTVS